MNWTCKLLAVALAAGAFLFLDFCTQTPNPPLLVGEEPRTSLESIGAGFFIENAEFAVPTVHREPYNVGEAYEVYLAIIPTVAPDPKTHMWFILSDTLFGHGSLSEENRKEWKKTRGLDTALDDFFDVNARTWLLQNKFTLSQSVQPQRNIPWLPAWGHFTLPKPYRLGTRDEIKACSPFGGVIYLSAVGFNTDKTVAVVYMLGGDKGTSFVLEKQNGKWKVSSALTLAVS